MFGEHNIMVGQRVVLNKVEIGIVVVDPERAKNRENTNNYLWVFSPAKGYSSYYSINNVKPLPNNQL